MSDYSTPPSPKEIERQRVADQLYDTPLKDLIESGITFHDLRKLLKVDHRYPSHLDTGTLKFFLAAVQRKKEQPAEEVNLRTVVVESVRQSPGVALTNLLDHFAYNGARSQDIKLVVIELLAAGKLMLNADRKLELPKEETLSVRKTNNVDYDKGYLDGFSAGYKEARS